MKKIAIISLLVIVLFVFGCAPRDLPPEPGAPGSPVGHATEVMAEGYAPSADSFSMGFRGNLMVKPGQDTVSIPFTVNVKGGFVYKMGYIYTLNGWQIYEFDTSAVGGSRWIRDSARAQQNIPANLLGEGPNYILAYTCKKVNGVWKCGCRSDSDCGYWMLQTFNLQIQKPFCTDAEQGADPLVAGSLVDETGIRKKDTCDGNNLIEYYCEGDKAMSKVIPCKSGCEAGACIELPPEPVIQKVSGSNESASSCTDSDGGNNIYVAGLADGRVDGLGTYFYDVCVTSNGGQCSGQDCTSVAEGICTEQGVSNVLMPCPSGICKDGACAPGLVDQTTYEKCTLPAGVACLDFKYSGGLIELHIQNSAGFDMSDVSVSVDGKGCKGQDSTSKSTLTNGETGVYTINCALPAGTIFSGALNFVYTTTETGMVHSKTGEIMVKIPGSDICTDSDGGKNYYIRGTGTGLYGDPTGIGFIWGENPNNISGRHDPNLNISIVYDACANSETSNILLEAYCDDNGILESESYNCPNGCKDGTCITAGNQCTAGWACTIEDNVFYKIYQNADCSISQKIACAGECQNSDCVPVGNQCNHGWACLIDNNVFYKIYINENCSESEKTACSDRCDYGVCLSRADSYILEEGGTMDYNSYAVTLAYVGPDAVKFDVDQEISTSLQVGDSFTFKNSPVSVEVVQIKSAPMAGERDAAEFVLSRQTT